MAEFKAGDRVVKMSGTGAGKYGTVNSVAENGTLNVTFDGERLPRYCDPMRCGQVAANATKSRLKGFKVGDKVKDRHGNVGIVEKIQTDDAGPFGPPPSKYGDLLGIKVDDGRIGWLNETNAVLANSRVANARTLPVSRQRWTECERRGIDAMSRHLKSNGGILPRTSAEVSAILDVVPGIDTTEKQNVMSFFKYGEGKRMVANANANYRIGQKVEVHTTTGGEFNRPIKITGTISKLDNGYGRVVVDYRDPWGNKQDIHVLPSEITKVLNSRVANAKFKVGDKVKVGRDVATIVREEGDDDPSIPGEMIYLVRFMNRPGSATVAESEIKSANSRACNANVKVGDRIVLVADAGVWRKGATGAIVGGDYLPGFFYVKFDDGSEGRIPEAEMAARNAVARNGDIDNATARRDIDLSLRKMADIAARISHAKATSKATHDEYMFAGYIDLNFPDADSAEAFNPYDVIYVLRDNKGILPKWAWGVGGFNYERRGNSWRIHIGRFAT